MSQIFFPVLFALLMWWISTGLILRVVGQSSRYYPASISVSIAVLAAALWGLATTSQSAPGDAYLTFTCVLAVWGFVELTFLTGYVTGPRKSPLPAGYAGWRRFRLATETILFHELLLLAMGAAVVIAAGPKNWLAWGTYAVLWVMRLSSKLNLFLGVPSLNADLLPRQLAHLASYFRRRGMNALLPLSIVGSAIATALLFDRANMTGASDYAVTAFALLGALLALALLEHLFMLMPFPVAALWGRRTTRNGANDNDLPQSLLSVSPAEAPAVRTHINGIRSLGGLK
jgi:putative photosynthetic complex assembly protein 2